MARVSEQLLAAAVAAKPLIRVVILPAALTAHVHAASASWLLNRVVILSAALTAHVHAASAIWLSWQDSAPHHAAQATGLPDQESMQRVPLAVMAELSLI